MGRVHTSKKDRHGAPGDSTSPPPIPHPEVGWPLRFWITRPLDVDSPNLAILGATLTMIRRPANDINGEGGRPCFPRGLSLLGLPHDAAVPDRPTLHITSNYPYGKHLSTRHCRRCVAANRGD